MFALIIRIICISAGMMLFFRLSDMFNRAYLPDYQSEIYNHAGFVSAGFLFGLLVSPYLERWLLALHKQILRSLQRYSPHSLASGFVGLLMGFLFAILVTLPLWLFVKDMRGLNLGLTILACIIFGYMGVLIFGRVSLWGGAVAAATAYRIDAARPKVLDTSVLIDGRILGLIDNSFIEGKIFIPDIVLNELQGIADDSEGLRRKRGRRGLDVVTQIKEREDVELEVVDLPAPRAGEATAVDARLVNYCKTIAGVLITNDFNLTKIAELRSVKVFNLNTLASSLRRSLLPGETIEANIVKYGKEHGQGIAYLDDGTMIVIEHGDKKIGETVEVEIKNIMQSVAGRLIFATIINDSSGEKNNSDMDNE